MSDSSALHGPREDDELKRELRSDLQAHRATRSEEWREPEAAGEDEPQPDETAGTPEGRARPPAEEAAYELRSELASYLGRAAIPGDRARITAILAENHAPDQMLDLAARLPGNVTYTHMREVFEALGLPIEHREGQ